MKSTRYLSALNVLWGVEQGLESWQETVLCTQKERFDEVKLLASKDGFSNFRETLDLGTPPNFSPAN